MNIVRLVVFFLAAAVLPGLTAAQVAGTIHGADERFKADILVVVAHPDDEGAVTPFLARAIYDLHKRVAVVFATRGGSGGNSTSKERAGALEDIREIEAREACARLGITNVWFLGAKDTASQNVMNSLANWGHGAKLEKLVELVRLTRADVIITSLPGVFFGEDHGDHQAAGVLSTEAFDLAGNPAAFPSQLAAASPKREIYEQNLNPWQPKKLYFVADGEDDKLYAGKGPSYSVREISPSQKKPYWRLALYAAVTHLTQYPGDIHAMEKLSDTELEKKMSDPDTGWWGEPQTLVFGKSYYTSQATDDVFAHFDGKVAECERPGVDKDSTHAIPSARLGGPWGYYEDFRKEHCLMRVPIPDPSQIAVKAGTTLSVPLEIFQDAKSPLEVTISADVPSTWKIQNAGTYTLPKEWRTNFRLEIDTPALSPEELKVDKPEIVTVHLKAGEKSLGEAKLKVLLRNGGLPQ